MKLDKNQIKNKIFQGNSIEILKSIPDETFDVVFADPPYNLQLEKELQRPDNSKVSAVNDKWDQFKNFQTYDDFSTQWLNECKRVLKKDGTLWVIGTYHNIFRVGKIIQDLNFWILNDVIWNKKNPMPNFKGTRFTNAHETLIWAAKSDKSKYTFNYNSLKCFNDDKQLRSDWSLAICSGKERCKSNGEKAHNTQKPEALLYRIILATTNKGDIILDPFFGTGTSGAVAKKLGRHYVGIEKEKRYIDVARKRIELIRPIKEQYLKTIEKKRNEKRIPFGMLVESGIIEPGITLYDNKKKYAAKVMADGSIGYKNITGSIHKVGAQLEGAPSCNGWSYWHFNIEGKMMPIDYLRQKIRSGN